jgi:hypothetical protein
MIILQPNMAADPQNTSGNNNDEVEFKLRKEEVTFIPYRELDKLLNKNKNLVYMSYKELTELINEKSQIRPLAPVNYVIKDLALTGIVQDDHISFDADYKIQILNKEWTYIPVISTQIGLKSAEFDGKPAPLSADNNEFRVLSDELGEHSLKLKFDVKLNESGNTKSFNFNMPRLPITRLIIKVPETPVKLNIANASGQREEIKDGNTITYASLIGHGNVQVDWKSNLVKMPEVVTTKKEIDYKRPSKVIAEVQSLITVDEGLIQGFSTYNCQIYHKPVEKLTLHIPDNDNFEVISVTSPGNIVKKGPPVITNPDKNKPGKLLTVYFNSKIKDNAVFNIIYEKTFENKKPAEVTIPNLYLTGREINKVTGYVAVQSTASLEIKEVGLDKISVMDLGDLPYGLTSLAEHPIILSYGFIQKDYKLDLEVIPHEDAGVKVAMIDKARIDSRLSTDGILTTRAEYQIRNMSESFFKFTLPFHAEILTATINGKVIQIGKEPSEDENIIYSINIKKHQNEVPFTLAVIYKQDERFNILNKLFINDFDLLAPDVKNIPTLTLSWTVYLPEKLKYWFITPLNRGYTNYASYITSYKESYDDYDKKQEMPEERVVGQVANIAQPSDYDISGGKVAGIAGTKHEMPPVTDLKRYDFSDYLLDSGSPSINVFSITKFVSLILFLFLLAGAWYLVKHLHTLIKKPEAYIERAKFVITWAIVIYIFTVILGVWTIILPLILALIAYVVFYYYQKRKERLTTQAN